jgi:glycosyltransferase involved in cell wall biosynthesis
MKVSVIIPTYKRKKEMVNRAIDSLINQTYEDIEIVLVDDNAKEEHRSYREEIEKYVIEKNNDKIIYIQNKKNLGGALARNAGMEKASGEYITFLDDDDRYLPKKIENQIKFMLENDLDMSFTDLAIYNEKNKLIDYREYSKIQEFNKDYLLVYHLTRQISGTPTFMYKKELLKKINGFDDVCMGQEFYLMSKTIESGAKIGYLSNCDVVAYRDDTEAISTGPNKIIGQKLLYEYKKSFFNQLKFRQKQYIRCRHYAVMAMAYKRNKKYIKSLFNLLIAVIISPIDAINEAFSLLKKVYNKG